MESAGREPEAADGELLSRLAHGCEESWREFYRRYQGRVYRFALQMTGSRALAEDAVQETFLALMKNAGQYDAARGPVAAYVFGIARNKVLTALARERSYSPIDGDTAGPVPQGLDDCVARQQEAELVRQAVLALPANYREAVVLCDLQQLDYENAARAIGCAIGTVRSRLHRGRLLLGERLAARLERKL